MEFGGNSIPDQRRENFYDLIFVDLNAGSHSVYPYTDLMKAQIQQELLCPFYHFQSGQCYFFTVNESAGETGKALFVPGGETLAEGQPAYLFFVETGMTQGTEYPQLFDSF